MDVSIHQPQYLPWLPYLLKAAETHSFILLDSVEFQKNGLQNRNRIKTAQGALWLTVPVRQRLGQKINEVHIDDATDWRKKHWQTILQSYRNARAFGGYADEIESVFTREWTSLAELNTHLFVLMLGWLGLEARIRRASEMKAGGKGSELVLNLCREAGATRYVTGTGGLYYLDETAFRNAGIEIVCRPPELPLPYPQLYPQAGFINDLSALDIILNCGKDWRAFLPGGKADA